MNQNIFIERLNKEAYDNFLSCISILENDKNSKEAFIYLLYNDLIKIENIEIDIQKMVDDPSLIVKEYLENIYYKINIKYIDAFKKTIFLKCNDIKKKIEECNAHIKIIKKIYMDTYFQEYLPENNKNKIIFDNKTVLRMENISFMYNLGQFFAKFIFNKIKMNDNENESELNHLSNTFYHENDYNQNYIDTTFQNITDFEKIDINFKYWIVFIFITGVLFDKKSDYYIIFNKNNFLKHMSELSIFEKKKDKKKKTNRNNLIKKILKQTGGNEKNTKKNKHNDKKVFYKNIMNKCFIDKKNNLYKIYYDKFSDNMKKYFENKIHEILIHEGGMIDTKYIKIVDPFNPTKIRLLSDYTTFKKDKIDERNEKNIFKDMKYNIFHFLQILNEKNEVEIEDFLIKIKKKILLLLFYLYNLKKKNYEEFITLSTEIFNVKENIKKENIARNHEITIKNENMDKNMDKNIQNIQRKINIMKNKKNMANYDEKILELENQIKKKIIEKYYLFSPK